MLRVDVQLLRSTAFVITMNIACAVGIGQPPYKWVACWG